MTYPMDRERAKVKEQENLHIACHKNPPVPGSDYLLELRFRVRLALGSSFEVHSDSAQFDLLGFLSAQRL